MYETTDSSLLIVHGSQPVSPDTDAYEEGELLHRFAVLPGPKALAMLYSSPSNTIDGSNNGVSSLLDLDTINVTTAHFEAITPSLALANQNYYTKQVLEPEISILEIPELESCSDGGDGSSFPMPVAIGINHGSEMFFIHVMLRRPKCDYQGWAAFNEECNVDGTLAQQQDLLKGKTAIERRACWQSIIESEEYETVWKTREEMECIHTLYFKESTVSNDGSTITVETATSSETTETEGQPPPRPLGGSCGPGLHIVVRMPSMFMDFDDVLGTFLTHHKLSTSTIADYYIQKVVDIAHFEYTTEDVLENDTDRAFRSTYNEISCVSPYLPNEPGLVFAVVVKFNEIEVRRQLQQLQEWKVEPGSSTDTDITTLFKTGVVAIFAHTSALSGLSHIMTALPWPEFKDPRKQDLTFYHEDPFEERNDPKSPLQQFQDTLALPTSFEKSLLVLSNSAMVREQGSLKAVFHPVLPQWLIGPTESVSEMQEHAMCTWGVGDWGQFPWSGPPASSASMRGRLPEARYLKLAERRW